MIDPVQEQVLGYLLGALDDAEMEQVHARLQSDERYRQQWTVLRQQLGKLDAVQCEFPPPSGLTERTCQFVFAHVKPAPRRASRGGSLTPQAAPASWASHVGWLDTAVAITVFLMAGMLTVPAIQSSRFHSRLTTCSDNLRELGTALTVYSRANQGYFPRVPTTGALAGAGVYAPTLAASGLLSEARRVVCPDSPLADQGPFRLSTLDEIQSADAQRAAQLRQQMGGSYGYCIGYLDHGVLQPTKNLGRPTFALMADAPREDRPDHQSLNHGGQGQNVLFEDGHVDFLNNSRPNGVGDDIFANDNNQVAAGLHCNDSVIVSSGVAPAVVVKGGGD